MIPLIKKTLQGEYDFLKYSTPNSGKSLEDKVILFAFKREAAVPELCIKTVRNYSARDVVSRGFTNLQRLNTLTAGSAHERLFPKALSLYDDGEHAFSVETAVRGRRERLTRTTLERVVQTYTAFQAHVAERALRPLDELADGLLSPELRAHYDSLPPSSVRLPRVLQLGDLTEDNVLLEGQDVRIVDFDRVGEIDLPGFDLFGLLRRFDGAQTRALCAAYMPAYLEAIGAEGDGPYERLLFLYFVAERTVRKTGRDSAQHLIGEFNSLL